MRVLSVGNSYTFFNDLPGLLSRLAEGGGAAIETEMVVAGGMTLFGHLRQGRATAKVRAGGWDVVVLQEQSTRPIEAPALMGRAVARFRDEIARAGASTLLFLTWAPQDHPERQAVLDATYAAIARRVDAGRAGLPGLAARPCRARGSSPVWS